MRDVRRQRPCLRPKLISSLQNDRIKAIRALDLRKVRRETGLFVAEGSSVLISAREAGWQPETVLFEPNGAQSPVVRALIGVAGWL
jgi:TrmH family RNA methyltransferase